MKRITKVNQALVSKIKVRATLLTDLKRLKDALGYYPNLKQVSRTRRLSYEIEDSELMDIHYTLEFADEWIAIELHSSVSPFYFLNEMLVRLIGIIAFLKEHYTIVLDDLAPYLIESLSMRQLDSYMSDFELKKHEHNGDLVLSKRIISLAKENAVLDKELGSRQAQALLLLQKLIISSYGHNSSIEMVKEGSGVGGNEIKAALEHLPELGYKVVYSSREKFNVVKYGG